MTRIFLIGILVLFLLTPQGDRGSHQIVASPIRLSAQTASIAPTNIATNLPDGLYRVSYYARTTTAAVAGTMTVTIGWNDGQARSNISAALSLTALSNAAISTPVELTTMRVANTSSITYETTVAGVVGNPQYELYITLERLQ